MSKTIELKAENPEVHANIDGKVLSINVSKGDRITPGEILIEIG